LLREHQVGHKQAANTAGEVDQHRGVPSAKQCVVASRAQSLVLHAILDLRLDCLPNVEAMRVVLKLQRRWADAALWRGVILGKKPSMPQILQGQTSHRE